MTQADLLILNIAFLKNRIAELGLKQWWLAEQVGVDRKTVSRWLNGQGKSSEKPRSIQAENAKALAQVLGCSVADLILSDGNLQIAGVEEQKVAAQFLASSSLLEKLGPIGEWNVIESLLKATMVSDLPLEILGKLYNQLTIASWRQSKIDQAEIYNNKTKEIALKLKDKFLLAQALLSEANIQAWRGQTKKAIYCFSSILDLERFVTPRLLGATHSNLGGVLYEAGEIDRGLQHVEKSISCFLIDGTAMNLSISRCHQAIIYLQKRDLDSAANYAQKTMELALAVDYRRGVLMGYLIQSEIAACKNLSADSDLLLQQALEGFHLLNIEEGLNYEFAGRICRLNGNLDRSQEYLKKGISISNEFPLYQAAIFFELARTEKALGQDCSSSCRESLRLYKACEADTRAEMVHTWLISNT